MMRKMIFMAVAGYLWRKFQARGFKPNAGRAMRRPY
jgi:hypothetical protein